MFRAINNLSLMVASFGVLGLLSCSAGMAATVTVTASTITPLVGTDFTVTISGSDFTLNADPTLTQETIGATLGLSITGGISYVTPSPNNLAALPTTGPFRAANGSLYTPNPASGLPVTFDVVCCLSTGVGASGSFDALVLTFHADSAGPATISLVDNGTTLTWFQYDDPFDVIPVSYNNQARLNVIPLPAAAWLIAPAFGVLVPWVKRRANA